MFFISPIKTIYSIKFYLEKLKEPLWKAFLFFVYLFALASVFLAIYMPAKMNPLINDGITQVAQIIPDITVTEGVINANNNRKLVIDDKILQGYKVVFDTASEEPGYPTQMEKEKVLMYVNKDTIYASFNGQFQETHLDENVNVTLSKQELLKNKDKIAAIIKYLLILIAVFTLLFRMLMLAILALIVALIMNAAFKLNLPFKKMLILALYLQGPVVILDLILMLLPVQILGMSSFVALVIFLIYINLIYTHLRVLPKPIDNVNQREE